MDKKFLLAGAVLLGGLFSGATSCTPTAPPEDSAKEGLAAGNYSRQFTDRKSALTKPTSQPVAPRKVVAQTPSIIYGPSRVFIEKPHLRKVKYGKRRWILV